MRRIREGYETYLVDTTDDRSLSGFLVDKDNQVVVLRGLDGQNVTLARKDITTLRTGTTSLMPEGLLKTITTDQFRDLIAYLMSPVQVAAPPTLITPARFGRDCGCDTAEPVAAGSADVLIPKGESGKVDPKDSQSPAGKRLHALFDATIDESTIKPI